MRWFASHAAVAANETNNCGAGRPATEEAHGLRALSLVTVWISNWEPKRWRHQLRSMSGCPHYPTSPSTELTSRNSPTQRRRSVFMFAVAVMA